MAPAYESDLAAWIDGMVQWLREKAFDAIDVDALIEELDSVGGSERSAKATAAWRQAAVALALPLATIPEDCPWGIAEILDRDFFPEQ